MHRRTVLKVIGAALVGLGVPIHFQSETEAACVHPDYTTLHIVDNGDFLCMDDPADRERLRSALEELSQRQVRLVLR